MDLHDVFKPRSLIEEDYLSSVQNQAFSLSSLALVCGVFARFGSLT
jgi:hypothetical protein